jgi:hypothetical protein
LLDAVHCPTRPTASVAFSRNLQNLNTGESFTGFFSLNLLINT